MITLAKVSKSSMPVMQLKGIAASAGWAIGTAHVLSEHALTVPHHHIALDQIAHEQSNLKAAFAAVHAELDRLNQSTAHKELHALIEVHQQMLGDPVLYDAALAYVHEHCVNAAWALSEQVQQLAQVFEGMDDAYLAERALDVRQVGQRVLKQLLLTEQGEAASTPAPRSEQGKQQDIGQAIILVAQDLAPADFVQWQHVALAGLVTELGGQSSHTAIMARAQGIPAVLGIAQADSQIKDGDVLVLNGSTGDIWVNPSEAHLLALQAQQNAWNAQQVLANEQVLEPAITACGQSVRVMANIEHPDDMPAVLSAGLDGVGLFRSEFLFMGQTYLPTEDEQTDFYTAVVQALAGGDTPRIATIRTLDIGADKLLSADFASEANVQRVQDSPLTPNPALGLRAVRYCLANPVLFLTQLRAILRAAAHGPVYVMLPMIASVSEVLACKALLSQAQTELSTQGLAQGEVKLGVMIEIPAAAIAIDSLLPHIDFCSVGTNDLIQYTLAIDRTNAAVAPLYDPLHPAITALLSRVFKACAAAGRPVGVCGEMAGDARYTHHLLDLGLRQFSLNASQAPAVKMAIRQWRASQPTENI